VLEHEWYVAIWYKWTAAIVMSGCIHRDSEHIGVSMIVHTRASETMRFAEFGKRFGFKKNGRKSYASGAGKSINRLCTVRDITQSVKRTVDVMLVHRCVIPQ
jgi:hypothetical protein